MKYIICVMDGAGDVPIESLDGKTPLQVANKPNLNYLAKNGIIGTVRTIPIGMSSGTEVGIISVFGYDPDVYHIGRGLLEATSLGIKIDERDVAFRCNFVTIKDNKMLDFSAGHISSEEAKELIQLINKKLGTDKIKFFFGKDYRHVMVWKGGSEEIKTFPPHHILGKEIDEYLPRGKGEKVLKELIKNSYYLLEGHEINRARRASCKNPANSIWIWGPGKKVSIPSYKEKFNVEGGVISAVDVVKGMGKLVKLQIINVPGITGYYDTNYAGKAEYAIKFLNKNDFCLIHIQATDEASHNGELNEKIKSIENIDEKIIGKILKEIKTEFRILVLPDHITEVVTRVHSIKPVPFVMYGNGINPMGAESYDEFSCSKSVIHFDRCSSLISNFLQRVI
jgi:2,3-bisphosphoglycerate-independent phosphoglycerate mutase